MTAPTWSDFVSALDLFRDPILAGTAAGVALGCLGLLVVLRRMVFVTATLSQTAGLGVVLAFYAEIHMGMGFHPYVGAIGLTTLAALLFSAPVERWRLSRESMLAFAYVGAGGLAVLLGDRITQEAHDISSILFGTGVLVRPEDLRAVLGAAVGVLLVLALGFRGFVFAAFDPDGARVQGLPVRSLEVALLGLVTVQVATSTRALGALPVFAFAVLPAMAALLLGLRLPAALAVAGLLGGLAGGLGYVLAFFLNFPVGGSQTVLVALFVALAAGVRAVRRTG